MHNTGHCHCGAVSFTIEGAPLRMAQCHCNACRRSTGTGHSVQAFFKKDQVEIKGETITHESTADSGNTRKRQFCAQCGSRLFSESSANPVAIGVAVGALDETEWFKPDVIVYNSERSAWDVVDPSIELHDMM